MSIRLDASALGLADATAVYSMTRVNPAYRGPIVRLRRRTDGAERDFYTRGRTPDLGSERHGRGLSPWCWAASSAPPGSSWGADDPVEVDVVVWYDQSGRDGDARSLASDATRPPPTLSLLPDGGYVAGRVGGLSLPTAVVDRTLEGAEGYLVTSTWRPISLPGPVGAAAAEAVPVPTALRSTRATLKLQIYSRTAYDTGSPTSSAVEEIDWDADADGRALLSSSVLSGVAIGRDTRLLVFSSPDLRASRELALQALDNARSSRDERGSELVVAKVARTSLSRRVPLLHPPGAWGAEGAPQRIRSIARTHVWQDDAEERLAELSAEGGLVVDRPARLTSGLAVEGDRVSFENPSLALGVLASNVSVAASDEVRVEARRVDVSGECAFASNVAVTASLSGGDGGDGLCLFGSASAARAFDRLYANATVPISITSDGRVGVSLSNSIEPSSAALEVAGDIFCWGDVYALSDARAKTETASIEGALDRLCELCGYTYAIGGSSKRSTGLMAQDVQRVLPEAVQVQTGTGKLSIAYGNMMGLVVEAIKELRSELEFSSGRSRDFRKLLHWWEAQQKHQ